MTSSDDATEAWSPATDGVEGSGEQSSEDNPKGSSGQNPIPDRLEWLLPEQSDKHDTDGRTGFLSTFVEWHALVLGVAVGTHVAASGDVQLVADVLGLSVAGSRAQKGLPEKYVEQAKSELPYFAFGVAVVVVGARASDMTLLIV